MNQIEMKSMNMGRAYLFLIPMFLLIVGFCIWLSVEPNGYFFKLQAHADTLSRRGERGLWFFALLPVVAVVLLLVRFALPSLQQKTRIQIDGNKMRIEAGTKIKTFSAGEISKMQLLNANVTVLKLFGQNNKKLHQMKIHKGRQGIDYATLADFIAEAAQKLDLHEQSHTTQKLGIPTVTYLTK